MTTLDKMSDDEVVAHVRKCVTDFDKYAHDWREEAREGFEIVAGRQWPAADLTYLKDQNRPPVTFNRIAKFIDVVAGTEATNKMECLYIGGVDDTAAIDLLTSVIRRVSLDTVERESTAGFRDMLTCGYGWTDTRIDYTLSMEGRIVEEHVDPFHVGWDPRARKSNLEDARWVYRIKNYSKEELDEEWEGASDKVMIGGLSISADDRESTDGLMDSGEYDFETGDDESAGIVQGKYRVICFQQQTVRTKVIVVNPLTRQTESMELSKFDEARRKLAELGTPIQYYVKHKQRVWHIAYVCGTELLGEVEEIPCRTLEVMTGKYDRNKQFHYGMVRAAKDPQLWENKFRSNIMHVFSSAGKGVMVEEDAIAQNDWRKFENDWARPDRIKRLASGAISQNKIKSPDPVPLPPGLADLMVGAASAVPDVLGISQEWLGMAQRTQSGVVEGSRRRSSMVVASEYFQSRREHIKRTGRIKISHVLHYIPDSLFTRIGGEEALQVLPMMRQASFEQYDVQVDEAPATPDQKAEIWNDIMQLAPILIPMGIPTSFWLTALSFSPWPASLVNELKQSMSQPDPSAQQAQQLDLAQKQADVAETQSKVALNQAKAQEAVTPDMSNVLAVKAQADKSAMDAGFKTQEHNLKMQQMGATAQATLIKGLLDIQKAKIGASNNA